MGWMQCSYGTDWQTLRSGGCGQWSGRSDHSSSNTREAAAIFRSFKAWELNTSALRYTTVSHFCKTKDRITNISRLLLFSFSEQRPATQCRYQLAPSSPPKPSWQSQTILSASLLTSLDISNLTVKPKSPPEPLSEILPEQTESAGIICFIIHRPGWVLCREHGRQLMDLANNSSKVEKDATTGELMTKFSGWWGVEGVSQWALYVSPT